MDQSSASGRDHIGTLPFIALDLLLEKRFGGETTRRYRHEAESFAWSLICLYFATAEGKDGKNYTRNPHPLRRWFEDREISHNAKFALQWRDRDIAGILLAYPNARQLACALHKYWVDRYIRQLQEHDLGPGPQMAELFGRKASQNPLEAPPPYQEPEDDEVFVDVLVVLGSPLASVPLKEIREDLFGMSKKFQRIDWSA